jgi:hypothetical protein
MSKYEPLGRYLSEQAAAEVTLSIDAIEKLVGRLPNSASAGNAWWLNESKVQVRTWRSAGWRIKSIDRANREVIFERIPIGGLKADSLAKTELASPRSATAGKSNASPAESHNEQSVPSEQSVAHRRETNEFLIIICTAIITSAVTAAVTAIGLFGLPRLEIFVIALDLSAVVTVLSGALTESKYRTALLWTSNIFLLLLVSGTVIYNLFPGNSQPARATFVRDATAGQKTMLYGHSYLAALKEVYLPPGSSLWVELATPLEQTGSLQRYSYFYVEASPVPGSNAEYYSVVTPNNTASRTTDVLTVFACSTMDGAIVDGAKNVSLRKIDGCSGLDFICIAELNNRPKYKTAPFVPDQCNGREVVALPMTHVLG